MQNEYETTSFDCLQVSASRAAEAEDVEGVEEAGRCSDETKDGRLEGVEAVSCECDNMEVELALFTCLTHLALNSLFPLLHTKSAGDLKGKCDTHSRYLRSNQRQSRHCNASCISLELIAENTVLRYILLTPLPSARDGEEHSIYAMKHMGEIKRQIPHIVRRCTFPREEKVKP